MKKGIVLKMILGMAFCVLCLVGQKTDTRADVIWFPMDEFSQSHSEELRSNDGLYQGRSYEVTEDAVDAYKSPESDVIKRNLKKEEKIRIYYVYEDKETSELWGCLSEELWVRMKSLKLLYDHKEFMKEHVDELFKNTGQMNYYNITYPFNLYHYPGSGELVQEIIDGRIDEQHGTIYERAEGTSLYEDEEGKTWAYIHTYSYGYIRGWLCLSDFEKLEEAWTLSDDIFLNLDYEEGLTLSDARLVLKCALGIESTAREYTLEDALRCLEYALGIR